MFEVLPTTVYFHAHLLATLKKPNSKRVLNLVRSEKMFNACRLLLAQPKQRHPNWLLGNSIAWAIPLSNHPDYR